MRHGPARVRGVSLVIVMLILVIVSMLGVASVQISMMGERGARNDRDMQLAWQGAEAALIDAEIDISGPNTASASRTAIVLADPTIPGSGCLTIVTSRGFCNSQTSGSSKPTWLNIDFTNQGTNAPSVTLGTFTDRTFNSAGAADGTGIQPAFAPRYIIEAVPDPAYRGNMVTSSYPLARRPLYRVTAIGFGPRSDIQAVVQALYRN
jgi:type IV pilus assembly protein PilX